MKTVLTLIAAGALLATGTFAMGTDPAFEERFRAKTGRYTPAEETRRLTIAKNAENRECALATTCCQRSAQTHTTAAANVLLNAKLGRRPATPADCNHEQKAVAAISAAETRHRTKFGRATNNTGHVKAAAYATTCCD